MKFQTCSHHFLAWWGKSWRITRVAVTFGVIEKASQKGTHSGSSKRAPMIVKFLLPVNQNWSTYATNLGWERESYLWKHYDNFKTWKQIKILFFWIKRCDINFETCEKPPQYNHTRTTCYAELLELTQVGPCTLCITWHGSRWPPHFVSKRKEKEHTRTQLESGASNCVLVATTSFEASLACLFVYVRFGGRLIFYLPPLLTMRRLWATTKEISSALGIGKPSPTTLSKPTTIRSHDHVTKPTPISKQHLILIPETIIFSFNLLCVFQCYVGPGIPRACYASFILGFLHIWVILRAASHYGQRSRGRRFLPIWLQEAKNLGLSTLRTRGQNPKAVAL